ncbi:DUF6572 domain-containing protein [Ruminococcus sp.]|uniref:DUF6572 domain-containing protein n=1 Tax=Ruminococcus sp. TaxID=41978 RepID=UPI0025EFD8BA|nr:DUF6572 domain-containing protein [Ruminococcus sp.]MBQ8966710.1 hypothetical protein [Ruminococcus sp.]
MLNIEKTDSIDSVAYDADKKMLAVMLVDGMDWEDEEIHLQLLKDKLNNYLLYIDTRQFDEKYPDTQRIELRAAFLYELPERAMFMVRRAGEVLETLFENSILVVDIGPAEE